MNKAKYRILKTKSPDGKLVFMIVDSQGLRVSSANTRRSAENYKRLLESE